MELLESLNKVRELWFGPCKNVEAEMESDEVGLLSFSIDARRDSNRTPVYVLGSSQPIGWTGGMSYTTTIVQFSNGFSFCKSGNYYSILSKSSYSHFENTDVYNDFGELFEIMPKAVQMTVLYNMEIFRSL